ncbi:hypothetical protein A4A49_21091 [Nicotiana attenuata]|uniref:NAC domain-containing protein n=1 Tax=Nicotiana attenuata TaxID=49451 RepID=A0A1J6IJZ5_NICAT|nr:hypothetical protein A4A49_21091 [Nicotiana attenuata]
MNMMKLDDLREGYRFRPTDSELVKFLLRFVAKQELHDNGFIAMHDVYKQEPWVTYSHGHSTGGVEDNWDTSIYRYFITPRKKNKGRFRRTVGKRGGTWKQQDKGRAVTIKSCDQRKRDLIIGRMKSMCYTEKNNTKCINSDDYNDGKWLMKEYVLSDPILNKFSNSERKDYVMCAIKKLPKRSTSCNFSQNSNVTTTMESCSEQEKVDTEVTSDMNNYVVDQPLMVQDYFVDQAIVESVEPLMVETVGINSVKNQEYNEVITPIYYVEEPMEESKVQSQEATGVENGSSLLGLSTFSQIQEFMTADFENAMQEFNVPEIKDRLAENMGCDTLLEKNQTQDQEEEGCTFAVNEEHNITYVESEAKATSFLELLTGCRGYAMGNNLVQLVPDQSTTITTTMLPQFRAGSWNRLYEPLLSKSLVPESTTMLNSNEIATGECDTTPCSIQPATDVTLDFEGPTTTVEVPEVYLESELNTILQLEGPDSVEPEVHTQEGGELVLLDEGTGNEEDVLTGETITETESSFFSDLMDAMLDNAPMTDRLAAMRMDQTVMLDQQCWESKMHLQEMLL